MVNTINGKYFRINSKTDSRKTKNAFPKSIDNEYNLTE